MTNNIPTDCICPAGATANRQAIHFLFSGNRTTNHEARCYILEVYDNKKGRIFTASAIKAQIEEAVGKDVSKDYLYDILRRHGWRKVVPRPQHPKADTEKQE